MSILLTFLEVAYNLDALRVAQQNKDHNNGFIRSRWFIHWFLVDLGNSLKAIIHDLPIKGMIDLTHWDGIPMVSTPEYIITYQIRLMVKHDVSLPDNHDYNKLP